MSTAETYAFSDDQWNQINSALLTGAGACTVHAPEVRDALIKASIVMDSIVDANEKPLSSYPEDRAKMLALCAKVEASCDDESAVALADLVKAILEDEAA